MQLFAPPSLRFPDDHIGRNFSAASRVIRSDNVYQCGFVTRELAEVLRLPEAVVEQEEDQYQGQARCRPSHIDVPAPFSTRLQSAATRIISRTARDRIPDLALRAKLW